MYPDDEDEICSKPTLEVQKHLGRSECREGSRQGAVAPNEAMVEMSKSHETF
jgi:hypothetical protein